MDSDLHIRKINIKLGVEYWGHDLYSRSKANVFIQSDTSETH